MSILSSATQTSEGGAAAPKRFDIGLDDGATVVARVYGEGPRLVLSHGNGLAIEAYKPFWQLLMDRHQVVMFDFRHHGLSSPYRSPLNNWPQFIRDFGRIIASIDQELGPAPRLGVFHSMSSLTALLDAAAHPRDWLGIIAFEPPVPPRLEHAEFEPFFEMHRKLSEGAMRRRREFSHVSELVRSFRGSDSFRRLDDEALRGLASATLRRDEERNIYELACAREFEAETFRLRNLDNAWDRVASVKPPVCIVAGVPGPGENKCLAKVAGRMASAAGFTFREIPDSTHFMQLERPRECVAVVEEFLASVLPD